MNADRRTRLEELFHLAVDRPAGQRETFLHQACAEAPDLCGELRALVDAHQSSASILDTPAPDVILGARRRTHLQPGQRIGAYEIVRLVGSGGMGMVYEAQQPRPNRRVALKILQTNFAGHRELRRFRYEAELLGRLQHPNIAPVYEAGLHDNGVLQVPYFAMELIDDPLNLVEFAKRHHLDTRQRLEMFARVCDAVQYGHQKGIVHRDLKPGNILVDPRGTPRIIDYGVAQAVDSEWAMSTLRTSAEAFVGTLQYMSPEQLRIGAGETDTRSDVYALGLIAYELLAERRPYELAGRSLGEALKAIETAPPAPLRSVDRQFKGDLSTIVDKAMAKDIDQRYQTVADLAADIQRYLRHEPILARPAGTLYRLRKFAERHRAIAAGSAIGMAALVAGTAIAAWQYGAAVEQRNIAQAQARKSDRINDFLCNVLQTADPRSRDADLTIREAVDLAVDAIDQDLADEPEVAGDVHAMIGSIYVRRDQASRGAEHLLKALAARRMVYGNVSPEVANILSDLAWALEPDSEACRKYFEESLDIWRRLKGADSSEVATLQSYIAGCYTSAGMPEKAEALLRDAIAKLQKLGGPEAEGVAFATRYLGTALLHQGREKEAEEAYRRCLALQRKVYGPGHYELAFVLCSLADLLETQGRTDEAARLRKESDDIRSRRVGPHGFGQRETGQAPPASSE